MAELQAGRELDVLVAEKVMGWQRLEREAVPTKLRHASESTGKQLIWKRADGSYACAHCDFVPSYSTDIADAWQVVEHVRNQLGKGLLLHIGPDSYTVSNNEDGVMLDGWDWSTNDGLWVSADTAPLAICRAALVVVGYEA